MRQYLAVSLSLAIGAAVARYAEPAREIAPTLETVDAGRTYIVKLECAGCPSRVRETQGEVEEELDSISSALHVDHKQRNSLLLWINVDDDDKSVRLNGQRIAPLGGMPLPISAVQVPSAISAGRFGLLPRKRIMHPEAEHPDSSYATWELQYEHTLLASAQRGEEWLQFDVTGIHIRSSDDPESYSLDKHCQPMVQLLLSRDTAEGGQGIVIKDIEAIPRHARQQPLRMKCGRLAMLRTRFDPREWDAYGKIGSWSRAGRRLLANMVQHNIFYLVLLCVGVHMFRRLRAKRLAAQQAYAHEDDFADFPPPAYFELGDGEEDGVDELGSREKRDPTTVLVV